MRYSYTLANNHMPTLTNVWVTIGGERFLPHVVQWGQNGPVVFPVAVNGYLTDSAISGEQVKPVEIECAKMRARYRGTMALRGFTPIKAVVVANNQPQWFEVRYESVEMELVETG